MNRQTTLGGTLTLPGTSLNLYRMGYGAMQLAGPGVWGLPPNIDEAVGVLRDALAAGVNHIDTSDFYGPSVTNQLIKQVLHPYPDDLVIVTKVGYRRGSGKSWLPALSRLELIRQLKAICEIWDSTCWTSSTFVLEETRDQPKARLKSR